MSTMKGHILIAMPHIRDPYFSRSLVFVCEHDDKGAMGLIFNKSFDDEGIKKIFPTLIINDEAVKDVISPLYFGGPVDLERGFLLHSSDYRQKETLDVTPNFYLTSNAEILGDIKSGNGPRHYKMMLGYAGWGNGQLERELENGDWLFQDGDTKFVFAGNDAEKWGSATQSFGITVASGTTGLA